MIAIQRLNNAVKSTASPTTPQTAAVVQADAAHQLEVGLPVAALAQLPAVVPACSELLRGEAAPADAHDGDAPTAHGTPRLARPNVATLGRLDR